MADPPRHPEPDIGDDTGGMPGRGSKPPAPRWVKVFAIIAAVLVLLVILMLTGVFGRGHGPGRHLGGRGDVVPASGQPHPRRAGGPAGPGEAARTIEVTALDSMTFRPATIRVSPGETVTFAVTNAGRTAHEFTLGDAAMQQEHAQAMAHIPAGVTHEFPNSISLPPGETKRLTWRFGDMGPLEYACHVRGHYEAGMRGEITIT